MSTPAIDYTALAQQAGAVSSTPAPGKVDYSAIAASLGGTSTPAEKSSDASKKEEPGYWEGLKAGAAGLVNSVLHPGDAITSIGKQLLAGGITPYGTPIIAPTGNQQRDEANQSMQQGARDDLAKQGAFMAQHPAYAAGQLTPAIATAAAGEVLPRVIPSMASGAGRVLLRGKTPEAAYESALKPSVAMSPADRASVVQTGLQGGIPVSKGGLAKLGDLIDDLNQKIAAKISADPTRPIDPNAVATRVDQLKPRLGSQVNASQDLDTAEASKQQFLAEQGSKPGTPATPPRPTGLLDAQGRPIMNSGTPAQPPQPAPAMPAAKAQAMKQGTYESLSGKAYGEMKTASIEAQKALARGLKEEIANQFPELNELNANESRLLDLQPVIEQAVNRISNHQGMGIGTPITSGAVKAITGSGSAGAIAGVLKAVLDNPFVKSRLAIAVSKGAKMPYATAAARVGAYSAALGSYTQAATAPVQIDPVTGERINPY